MIKVVFGNIDLKYNWKLTYTAQAPNREFINNTKTIDARRKIKEKKKTSNTLEIKVPSHPNGHAHYASTLLTSLPLPIYVSLIIKKTLNTTLLTAKTTAFS